MAVALEGGCRVTAMREGEPRCEGNLKIWQPIGRDTGAQAISLRVLEVAPGPSRGMQNSDSDEVLYVLDGAGTISFAGQTLAVGPEMGIYIKPGTTFAFTSRINEPLVCISCRCPEPDQQDEFVETLPPTITNEAAGVPIVRLADRQALPTADRWYRVLVDDEVGSRLVTQFIGSIPPGRAPDHYHHYEEVLFILRGQGRMWAGETHTPIAAGSCVYLPNGQVHCVENTGDGELRLLGVFYPAGSPAVRYEAD